MTDHNRNHPSALNRPQQQPSTLVKTSVQVGVGELEAPKAKAETYTRMPKRLMKTPKQHKYSAGARTWYTQNVDEHNDEDATESVEAAIKAPDAQHMLGVEEYSKDANEHGRCQNQLIKVRADVTLGICQSQTQSPHGQEHDDDDAHEHKVVAREPLLHSTRKRQRARCKVQ